MHRFTAANFMAAVSPLCTTPAIPTLSNVVTATGPRPIFLPPRSSPSRIMGFHLLPGRLGLT